MIKFNWHIPNGMLNVERFQYIRTFDFSSKLENRLKQRVERHDFSWSLSTILNSFALSDFDHLGSCLNHILWCVIDSIC